MNTFLKAAAVAAMTITGGAASAATISYSGTADGTDFKVVINDETAGQLNFVVTSTANPNSADLFALGFMWEGSPSPTPIWDAAGDFFTVSSNTGEAITNVCANCSNVGNGANFNGTGLVFDYIVRMGASGTQNNNYLTDFRFYISSTLSLAEAFGDTFGIRAQSTGDDGNGSIKLVNFTLDDPGDNNNPPPVVPLPAAGILLLGALGGMGALRMRRKAN